MNFLKRSWPIALLIIIVFAFFKPFIFAGKFPIPSDTIVGLYHPFRDLYKEDYPNGIPFKNFLITDPVRQQIPWRQVSLDLLKKGELPLWNPYTFGGSPLLANHQAAPLYPLNILFFVLSFPIAWSILILLQPLLSSIFMYFYLRNINIGKIASLLGGITFAFSGFSVAWMEWGTVGHVVLWLPSVLLSIDKIFGFLLNRKIDNRKLKVVWSGILVFSLASSFLAGHLQTFFYVFLLSVAYFFARWTQFGKPKKILLLFILLNSLFIIFTSVQWAPMLEFITLSGRNLDQADWTRIGWFIPWQHLIQFIAPDFFGNPTTLNYWGEWNYGEFIGYVGIIPLLFSIFALFIRRDKKTFFYGIIFFLSLIFSLPSIFAKIPFILQIPFISTAQPTRLLVLTDFSLAVLAALGFEFFMRQKKSILYPIWFMGMVFVGLWMFIFLGKNVVESENLLVTKNNLILPTVLFAIVSILLYSHKVFSKMKRFTLMIYIIVLIVTVFDLIRFSNKFTPFTNQEYLFPNTKTIEFLQNKNKEEIFRIATTDNRILPPNFSVMYRLQTVDGYDPLYLQRYGELIAASQRREPNISPPFGFNRIIAPHTIDSKIIDLLGVRYILSLSEIQSQYLTKVFQEGETKVYENKNVVPRAFFVEEIVSVTNKNEAIRAMFEDVFEPRKVAIVENYQGVLSSTPRKCTCEARIVSYSENRVSIETKSEDDRFLVLTDSFYPSWKATIDGVETIIYRTDYHFRGVFVPAGRHKVIFYNSLL